MIGTRRGRSFWEFGAFRAGVSFAFGWANATAFCWAPRSTSKPNNPSNRIDQKYVRKPNFTVKMILCRRGEFNHRPPAPGRSRLTPNCDRFGSTPAKSRKIASLSLICIVCLALESRSRCALVLGTLWTSMHGGSCRASDGSLADSRGGAPICPRILAAAFRERPVRLRDGPRYFRRCAEEMLLFPVADQANWSRLR